jgi:hypothetical protein
VPLLVCDVGIGFAGSGAGRYAPIGDAEFDLLYSTHFKNFTSSTQRSNF